MQYHNVFFIFYHPFFLTVSRDSLVRTFLKVHQTCLFIWNNSGKYFMFIHIFGTTEKCFIRDQSERLKKAGQIFFFLCHQIPSVSLSSFPSPNCSWVCLCQRRYNDCCSHRDSVSSLHYKPTAATVTNVDVNSFIRLHLKQSCQPPKFLV